MISKREAQLISSPLASEGGKTKHRFCIGLSQAHYVMSHRINSLFSAQGTGTVGDIIHDSLNVYIIFNPYFAFAVGDLELQIIKG